MCSEDKPRPLVSRAEIVPWLFAAEYDGARPCVVVGDLPLFWPGLPPPPPPPPFPPAEVRMSRMALAPKLMRLAKGVVGTEPSLSSSMADSSMLPLLAELMLSRWPRRELKGEVELGEEPERPTVVRDIRRR